MTDDRFGGKARWTVLTAALIAMALTGCGGRSSDGDGDGEGDDGGDEETAGGTAADITIQASSVRLASAGDSPVEITALVRDEDNNVVDSEPVQFEAGSGSLQVTQATTDGAGQALAELTPSNPANRTITVTASQGDEQASIDIEVFGTEIAIDGPGSLNPGSTGDYSATLRDSAGDPIPNQTITIESAQSNTIEPTDGTLSTDPSGRVRFSLTTAEGASSDDTITVSAQGASASQDIEVSNNVLSFTDPPAGTEIGLGTNETLTIKLDRTQGDASGQTVNLSTTRGTLTDDELITNNSGVVEVDINSTTAGPATITAEASLDDNTSPSASLGVVFVATEPDSLQLQADPSQIAPTESSTVTAVVRDPNGNLVANQPVTFNLDDSSNGVIDGSSATTNSEGQASVVYTASSTTSSGNGVQIEAIVNDGTSTISDTVDITVGGEALRLSISTGNELIVASETKYEQPWTVLVTDASGNPVANTDVELSVVPLAYFKGHWVFDGDSWVKRHVGTAPTPEPEPLTLPDDLDSPGVERCISEDRVKVSGLERETTQFNGIIDINESADENAVGSEDLDDDGNLEPSNDATVAPGTVTTDDSGFADFVVAYPKGNATWTEVRLEATVDVAGSERSETRTFPLRVLADDVSDGDTAPPGESLAGPYGVVGDCEDAR